MMFGACAVEESFAVAQVPSSQSAFNGMRYEMWVLPVSKLLEMQGPPLHHQRLIEAHCASKLHNVKCRAALAFVTSSGQGFASKFCESFNVWKQVLIALGALR